jgi:predicted phosphodiesterase
VRLGVLSDIHVVQDVARREAWHNAYDFAGVEARLGRALELFARERVELLLVLGDLAHDGDLASLKAVLRQLAGGPRVRLVGGNHDGRRPSARLREAGAAAAELPGWRAVTVAGSVRLAGARVACRAVDRCRLARPPALATWGDGLVLLASHFPLLSRERVLARRELPYAEDLLDRAALAAPIMARSAPTVALCGHLHVRDSASAGALLQVSTGALVEPPFEATVIELRARGEELELERSAHELARAPERRDPRLVPAHEVWRFRPDRGWQRRPEASVAPPGRVSVARS